MADEKEKGGGCGCGTIIVASAIAIMLWIWSLPSEEERAEEHKAKVTELFEQAQALPASAVCENYNKYKELQALEEKNGSNFYTDITSKKVISYGTKCLKNEVSEDRYFYSNVDKIVMNARNEYLNNLKSDHLVCRNPKITHTVTERSQPLWVLTGNYHDTQRHRRSFKLDNEDVEVLVRLAKNPDSTEHQFYETFTIKKSGNRYLNPLRSGANLDFLVGYRTGPVDAKVESYSIGKYDLNRETFKASFYETQTITDDGRRPMGGTIGEFDVKFFHSAEMTCGIISVSDSLDYAERRSADLRDSWMSEIESERTRKENERKLQEQQQKAKNKI